MVSRQYSTLTALCCRRWLVSIRLIKPGIWLCAADF
jgi:hypothetical protein